MVSISALVNRGLRTGHILSALVGFVKSRLLVSPDGCDLETFFFRVGIVRPEWNFEQMLTFHPRVHHDIGVDLGRFAWLECRLTDDNSARSTPFQRGDALRDR